MGQAPESAPRKRGRTRTRTRTQSQGAGLGRDGSADRPAKRVQRGQEPRSADTMVQHALLAQYYPEMQTLRQYALTKLPASSRIRRRKITSVGQTKSPADKAPTEDEIALGALLDSTIVARRHPAQASDDHRWEQWVSFSQKGDESYVTLSDGLQGSICSQAEVRQ